MHVADAIETIFRYQIDAFAIFRDVLLREHTALTQRNFKVINDCVTEHAQCVAQLEKLDHDFKAVLKQASAAQEVKTVDHILATLPQIHRSRLQAQWAALLNLVAECRDQNAVNSRLINVNRLNTEAALRVLKGLASVPTATYSPDGKVSAPSTLSAIATV